MKTIPLTQGKTVLMDDEDYELVSQYKWIAGCYGNNLYYASTNVKKNGKYITSRMHRLIMDASEGTQIDHKNRNGLDNRKCNLRFVTSSQNHQNSKPYRNGISKFKGVTWFKDRKKWSARIFINGKQIHLGTYYNETIAGWLYDKFALLNYREFARLNILPNPYIN